MSKLRPSVKSPDSPKPTQTKTPQYLSWPTHISEIAKTPRLYRIERLNAFEWQAFVTDSTGERPIGKPDLFDILRSKVNQLMKAEGQVEFMAAKTKGGTTS